MRPRLLGLAAAGLAAILGTPTPGNADDDNGPPEGFVALFNGKDLAGWHGMPHFDPRPLAAMSREERARRIAEWTEDAQNHWRVEDGELVNDGQGAYLTTDQDFGDIE